MCISNYHSVLQHTLLETEAENVRRSITSAVLHIRSFGEEVAESARKLGQTIQQIEGGAQVVQSDEGSNAVQGVSFICMNFWSPMVTPMSDGFWTMKTPKINGDNITMLMMSRHKDFIDNVVLGIQNKHHIVWHHQGLAKNTGLLTIGLKSLITLESYIYTAQNSIVLITTPFFFKAKYWKSVIWFAYLIQCTTVPTDLSYSYVTQAYLFIRVF